MVRASKKRLVTAFLLCMLTVFATGSRLQADDIIAGQVLLQIEWNYQIEPLIGDFNGISLDTIIDINTFLVGFPDSIPVDTIIQILLPREGVLTVQPNFYLEVPEVNQISQSFPDESAPPFLRGESPPSYYGQEGMYQIGLDSAHTVVTGDGIVAAIIDNGLDFNHELFVGAVADTGYDFIDNDSMPIEEPGEMYGHGTFVAGLLLLAAPDCKIIPLRAFNGDGWGNSFAISKAIYQAIADSVDIINMSFGLYRSDAIIELAVQDAYDNGIIMVASMGNDSSSTLMYPAAYSQVFAVSAIDTTELIAWFSNYGSYVDLCAPGVALYSSLAGVHPWGIWSGTSFSAPLVSGIFALMLEYLNFSSVDEAYQTLRQTARTELLWGNVTPPDQYYGSGCVDAWGALMDSWCCGDVNNSREINVADLTYLVNYLFKGGPPPAIVQAADVDGNGELNIADVNYLVAYLFKGGSEPTCQ